MATSLPAVGTVSYNGYTFPGVYRRTNISGRTKRDDANRTVIGVEYRIHVEFWITPADYSANGTADDVLPSIRQTITKQAGALVVTGIGFGDLNVNTGGGLWDMAFGPKPELIDWHIVGGNKSVYVTWECTTFVPECGSVSGIQGFLAFDFQTSFSTDKNWLTTITRSGYYEVALTRPSQNGRMVFKTAGDYRDLVQIPLLPNFTRERTEFKETLDKRRMDFTVVDAARYPNQLPWGCSAATGSHTSNNMGNSAAIGATQGIMWVGKIQANYTLLAKFPQTVAYGHFLDLCQGIWNSLDRIGSGFMPRSFTVNEGLYQDSQNVEFNVEYVFNSSWQDILRIGGFGKVAPNADGNLWIQKWQGAGYRPNSDLYRLEFSPFPDTIVDICQPKAVVTTPAEGAPRKGVGVLNAAPNRLGSNKLEPEDSWLTWKCGVEVKMAYGTVEHQILAPPSAPEGGGRLNLRPTLFPDQGQGEPKTGEISTGGALGGVPAEFYLTQGIQANSVAQQSIPTSVRLILWGEALRVFYTVPIPELVSVKGKKCTPIGTGHSRQVMVDSWCGLPVWGATWSKEYLCEGLQAESMSVPKPTRDGMGTPGLVL